MGTTKTELFTKEQNLRAATFKALAHPARIAIIDYLLGVNSCVCGDIVEALPLSQSTVSQHLREMKQAGLIQGEIEGKQSCYCVNPEALRILRDYLGHLFSKTEQQDHCC